MSAASLGGQSAIDSFDDDPFATRTTLHGLPSDEVRSALHKHVRSGRLEQSVRAAVELARTDGDHEDMMWQRLSVIAAEDVGLGDPQAICVIAALRSSCSSFRPGSLERLELAAQGAGFLAQAPKDPTVVEILQVVLNEDRVPEIPDEAIDVHTRRGQLAGRTLREWFASTASTAPEVEGRDTSWRRALEAIYAAKG